MHGDVRALIDRHLDGGTHLKDVHAATPERWGCDVGR